LDQNSKRLDVALVDRGLARSRNQASSLIESRRVFIDGKEARKSSQPVPESSELVVLEAIDYVSRAGHKLAAALEEFTEIEIVGKTCLDVGASTGGFTDVLLRYGASQVIALDVGHSQLAPSLADNRMVINIENFNARDLTLQNLQKVVGSKLDQKLTENTISVVVADLSFISLTLVLAQMSQVAPNAEFVLLIKPQFEVGKTSLDASGIVNDHRLRAGAIRQVIAEAKAQGLNIQGLIKSPLPGTHGNVEFLVWLNSVETDHSVDWSGRIDELAKERA
jgi:23S rRNA (cytidine1920-2'-O)/16S rRNA (cytidine1409-2'-O)-methyltransferase